MSDNHVRIKLIVPFPTKKHKKTMSSIIRSNDGGNCSAVVFGSMKERSSELGAADRVLCVGGSDDYNPESYARATLQVIETESPDLVLVGSTSMGNGC